jgi:hypothetical protein
VLTCLLKAKSLREIHDSISDQVADSPAFILSVLLNVWQKVGINLLGRKMFAKGDTRVNALHLYRVLFILKELSKDLEQLLLRNSWHQLYHIIEYNGGNFSHLWDIVLRYLNVHRKKFLLTCWTKMGVYCGDEGCSTELALVVLTIHEALDDLHDLRFNVF